MSWTSARASARSVLRFERPGNGAGDLRDFESVREAIAKMVGIARGENLRFGFQAAERARMNHAVAVARVIVAIRVLRFRVAAAARAAHVHGVGREHFRPHCIVIIQIFSRDRKSRTKNRNRLRESS